LDLTFALRDRGLLGSERQIRSTRATDLKLLRTRGKFDQELQIESGTGIMMFGSIGSLMLFGAAAEVRSLPPQSVGEERPKRSGGQGGVAGEAQF
jgi:hypothetical protein